MFGLAQARTTEEQCPEKRCDRALCVGAVNLRSPWGPLEVLRGFRKLTLCACQHPFEWCCAIRRIDGEGVGLRQPDCREHGWQFLRHVPIPRIGVNAFPAALVGIAEDGTKFSLRALTRIGAGKVPLPSVALRGPHVAAMPFASNWMSD